MERVCFKLSTFWCVKKIETDFKRTVAIIPNLKREKDVVGEARAEKCKKKGNYGHHFNAYLKKNGGGGGAMSQFDQKSVMIVISSVQPLSRVRLFATP